MQGWICLHRKIQENFLWKEPRKFSRVEAWLDILMEAQHTKEENVMLGNYLLKCYRGQSLKSLDTWAKRWGWTKSATRRFLVLLKKCGQIDTANETITTRLTVCNYGTYNKRRNRSETQVNHSRNANETPPAPDNKGNNEKNEKKRHHQHVFLTDGELTKLEERFGKAIAAEKIIELDEGIDSKGYKYNSHYSTILSWDRRKGGTPKPAPQGETLTEEQRMERARA